MFSVLLIVPLICFYCRKWILKRFAMYRLTSGVPLYPGSWPLLGHAGLFLRRSGELLDLIERFGERANQYDGIQLIWLRMRPHYVLTNPTDVANVLNNCLEKSYFYDLFRPTVGNGLFTAPAHIWKRHRRMLNPSFNQKVLNSFQGIFDYQARKLVAEFGKHVGTGMFDSRKYINHNALQTICGTAIGLSNYEDEEIDERFEESISLLFQISIIRCSNMWMLSDFLFNFTKLKQIQDKAISTLRGLVNKVLQKRRAEFEHKKKFTDHTGSLELKLEPFLQLILELCDENGALNDDEIIDEVITMIVAGYDTSALAIVSILVMVGSYPDVQDRLYREVKEMIGDGDRDVVKEDLANMVYLEAIINETLRLYPIGSLIARDVNKPLKIRNHTLPEGSTCLLFIGSLHRNSNVWGSDCQEFKPERWLNPNTFPKDPAAFCGFSYGRRGCIGKSYAMMSLKTTLSHIMVKYRITADQSKLRFKLEGMTRHIDGYHISLELR